MPVGRRLCGVKRILETVDDKEFKLQRIARNGRFGEKFARNAHARQVGPGAERREGAFGNDAQVARLSDVGLSFRIGTHALDDA